MGPPNVRCRPVGRPVRSEIESLKTRVWFRAVADRMGSGSAYAMEKRFSPEHTRTVHGVTRRPCKFDKYARGQHTPSPALVDEVELALPGTKRYIEHPFWEVARCPCTNLEALYWGLARLRPGITDLLFRPLPREGMIPERIHRFYAMTFRDLGREGDWDALTACIGLIQEAWYVEESHLLSKFTQQTFDVFSRFVIDRAFASVAEDLCRYLLRHFLTTPRGRELDSYISKFGVDLLIKTGRLRLLLVDSLGLLKHCLSAPTSCLHIVERYLTYDFLFCLPDIYHLPSGVEDFCCLPKSTVKEIRRHPVIRNLARALQRWEEAQSRPASGRRHTQRGHWQRGGQLISV